MAEDFEIDLLRQTVAQLIADAPGDLSNQVLDMGLLDLLVPEGAGGVGGSIAEALAVHTELGRGLAAVPYLQCTAAAMVLTELSLPREEGWVSLALDPDTLGWTLRPGPAVLPLAATVQTVLVADQGRLMAVPVSDLDPVPLQMLDASFPLHSVVLPESGALLGEAHPDAIADALRTTTTLGRAALCAEMLGSVERCVGQLLEHLEAREQFGQAIGTFQAVQHKVADIAIRLEGIRAYVHAMGQGVDAQTTDMALAYTAEGAREIVETALQLYGGMGFTWENPVHLHLRHALRCGPLLGTPRALRDASIGGVQ